MHCFCCGFSIFSKYLAQADTGTFRSPEHFHSLVQKEILRYQDCFSRSSVRSCAYNVTLSTEAEVCSLTAWWRICFFLFVCYSCLSPAKKKIWSISMLKIQAWEVYAIWSMRQTCAELLAPVRWTHREGLQLFYSQTVDTSHLARSENA